MGRETCNFENQAKEVLKATEVHDVDVLDKTLSCVGGMGLFQKLMFLAMMPFGIFFAFTLFVQLFITLTPQNYWCRVPELAHLSLELRRNLSAPRAISGDWNHCMTFDTNWTHVLETLTPPPPRTSLIPCPHGWEFDFSDIPYQTVVTERQWVCERASYVPIAQSMFSVGSITGSFIFGCVADRFGRIPAIIGTNLAAVIGGLATTFTSGLWDFMFCRFIVGLSFDGCFFIAYILFLEYLQPQYRTLFGNLTLAFAYGFGSGILPWLAYYVADWRMLLIVTASPGFFLVLLAWHLPESIRWLLSRGDTLKAVKILKKFETINKRTIPDDVWQELILSSNKAKEEENKTLLCLLKSPPLLKAILCQMVLFMGVSISLDGLIRLSGSFGMNFFNIFCVNAASEFVANFVVAFLLDRWGRRIFTGIPLVVAGMVLIVTIFMSEGLPRTLVAVIARFLVAMCFTSTLQWSTELLPTPIRASASSVLHISLFMSVIISPFIVFSEYLWKILPLLIFAAIAFFTAGITLFLPETKGLPMAQTIADGEKIIREHTLCGNQKNVDCVSVKRKIKEKDSMS